MFFSLFALVLTSSLIVLTNSRLAWVYAVLSRGGDRSIKLGGGGTDSRLSISASVPFSIIEKFEGGHGAPHFLRPCAAAALSENRYISTFPQLIQHNYRAPFLTTNHYVVGYGNTGCGVFKRGVQN